LEWLAGLLLAVAAAVPSFLLFALGVSAWRLTRLRWRKVVARPIERAAIPAELRALLDAPRAEIEALGFSLESSVEHERVIETPGHETTCTDVYRHRDGHTRLLVTPSPVPEPGRPCALEWVSCFADGSNSMTLNGQRHELPVTPPHWTVHDDYLADALQAWPRHLTRVQAAARQTVDDDPEITHRLGRRIGDMIDEMTACGMLRTYGPDRWGLRWRAALALTWRVMRGQSRAARARAQAADRAPAASAEAGGLQADVRAFEQQLALRRASPASSAGKWKVFLASAVVFAAVGGLWLSWGFVAILLAVVALHEGGHYLAMRWTGHRNLSVFFVPGLGGLAVGEKPESTPFEKLFVYLAGPVPGIALSVAGFALLFSGGARPPPWVQEFLLISLVINYLNLLPITPLDGGRVVETFLFARWPTLRFAFALASLAVLLGFGLWSRDPALLALTMLIALGLPHQWRVMQVQRALGPASPTDVGEPGAIRRAFGALQAPRFARWPFARRVAIVSSLLPQLQGRPATPRESVAGLTLYALCLLAPLAVAVLAAPNLASVVLGYTQFIGERDDVDEPAAARTQPRARPEPIEQRLARADRLAERERVELFLEAADDAQVRNDDTAARAHLQSAWALVQGYDQHDALRARTLLQRASAAADDNEATRMLRQAIGELAGVEGERRLLLAQAKETLAYRLPASERVALMREALAHRTAASPAEAAPLVALRGQLASSLGAIGQFGEAEALLRANVQAQSPPADGDRSRAALQRRTAHVQALSQLAWFLNDQDRLSPAHEMAAQAVAALPAKVTMSWEAAQQQALRALLWIEIERAEIAGVRATWQRIESSPRIDRLAKSPMFQLERLATARASQDASLEAVARDALRDMPRERTLQATAPLCDAQRSPEWRNWQEKRTRALARLATELDLCAAQK
jgi:Zn-dependent protease